jgi:hypothetical protein
LSHHYKNGLDPKNAFKYQIKSAALAVSSGAFNDGYKFIESSLDILATIEEIDIVIQVCNRALDDLKLIISTYQLFNHSNSGRFPKSYQSSNIINNTSQLIRNFSSSLYSLIIGGNSSSQTNVLEQQEESEMHPLSLNDIHYPLQKSSIELSVLSPAQKNEYYIRQTQYNSFLTLKHKLESVRSLMCKSPDRHPFPILTKGNSAVSDTTSPVFHTLQGALSIASRSNSSVLGNSSPPSPTAQQQLSQNKQSSGYYRILNASSFSLKGLITDGEGKENEDDGEEKNFSPAGNNGENVSTKRISWKPSFFDKSTSNQRSYYSNDDDDNWELNVAIPTPGDTENRKSSKRTYSYKGSVHSGSPKSIKSSPTKPEAPIAPADIGCNCIIS